MRASKLISILCHPIFMPIVAVYLSLNLVPSIGFAINNYIGFIYFILFLSTILLPLTSVFFLLKTGVISSFEINNHKERSTPIFITIIWMVYGYYKISSFLLFAPILKSEFLGAVVILSIASIISRFWKISLHMLGVGGLVGVLMGLNVLFGGLLEWLIIAILASGIVATARLTEGAHTQGQVYAGFFTGVLIEFGCVLLF